MKPGLQADVLDPAPRTTTRVDRGLSFSLLSSWLGNVMVMMASAWVTVGIMRMMEESPLKLVLSTHHSHKLAKPLVCVIDPGKISNFCNEVLQLLY